MKILRFSLLIAFIFTSSVLFAQKTGDFVLGGSFSYSNNSTKYLIDGNEVFQTDLDSSSSSNFSILPSFHWFVSDDLALGASIGYSYSKVFSGYLDGGFSDQETYNSVGMFVFEPSAYYYIKICDKFYYTPQLSIGYSAGKSYIITHDEYLGKSKDDNGKVKAFGIGLHLAKFEYRASDKIGVGVGLGLGHIRYLYSKFSYTDQYRENETISNSFSSAINTENLLGDITLSFKWYF